MIKSVCCFAWHGILCAESSRIAKLAIMWKFPKGCMTFSPIVIMMLCKIFTV